MREIRQSGLAGGEAGINRPSLPRFALARGEVGRSASGIGILANVAAAGIPARCHWQGFNGYDVDESPLERAPVE